ncbi:MAG: hypothetical protein PHY99_04330 [Bacteroidales bacterium]|nr:hypothetical protein [Bacteroidales bacterium]
MKKPIRIHHIALLFMILFSACSVFQWEKDTVKNGIHFTKVRQADASGVYIGLTDRNISYDGYEVVQGWMHFHPDWKLKAFQTARPVQVGVNILPAHTWLFPDSLGIITSCVLPEDQEIQGILCLGGGGISGIYAGFYPSGKLKGCYPVHNIEIDGVPCSNSLLFPVCLYEDGHLKSCKLSASFSRNNKTFKKGDCIEIDPDGNVRKMAK